MSESTTTPITLEGDPSTDLKLAQEFGLNEEEYDRAKAAVGRELTYAELGVISVMWSEHCSYKSSRVHLAKLPTTGPKVVQGPGENAGAVDIGDGFCAVFKMESHNHPSFIEPYQGAATGVGGIMRDVFTMGARPIANLNSLRFGRPDHPKTPRLLKGVVAGIGGYGNCMGVPTVGGEVQFDASYDGNILVNAFTVGIAKSDGLFFGTASGVGNSVIYVGARTGRDGIHGATMASASFEEEGESKLPTVQVGDPFMEKLLLECCLEIFAADCLEGVQDMGAAGLTSSSVEMASRAGTGLELDLDAIPRRTAKLSPYEMLLSESQERMLMVAKPGRENEVLELCAKWDLEVAVVGTVTDTGRFICKATPGFDPWEHEHSSRRDDELGSPTKGAGRSEANGVGEGPHRGFTPSGAGVAPTPEEKKIVVDLPIDLLADAAPKYDRPQTEPEAIAAPATPEPSDAEIGTTLLSLLASANIGSRSWIWRQYDHIVRDGTVVGPGRGDAAVVRAFCESEGKTIEKFLALSVDCNGRHVKLDPTAGAAMAVAECARNIVCVGGEPLGLTDCLNFGNPQVPETMWQFARAIDGLAAACNALSVPVVSGNVSLYNETDGQPILPTPSVAIVGQLQHPDDRLELAFRQKGDVVAHLGALSEGKLGGSEWLTQKTGEVCGAPQSIDLDAEVRLQRCVLALARARHLQSAHDVSDGGLGVCLAESCIAGALGASIELPQQDRVAARVFGEEPSRIVVSFAPGSRSDVEALCAEHGVPFSVLGEVGGESLEVGGASVPVAELADAHRRALEPIVGDLG